MKAQYAKSTDPEVLSIVSSNGDGMQRALEAAHAWAQSKGSPDGRIHGSAFLGSFAVWAIALPQKPNGWAVGPRGHGYRPRKGSAEYAEMEALAWKKAPVPGLPGYFTGPENRDGQSVWMSPAVFVSENAAWVLLSQMPVEGEFGEQWVEVKASEAHAARETLVETEKAAA